MNGVSEDDVKEVVQFVKQAIDKEISTDYEEVTARVAESDTGIGVSVSIPGRYIPIRPIIEATVEEENWKIGSIGKVSDIGKIECPQCETEQFLGGVTVFFEYESEDELSEAFA